ncbi:MAG: DNA double-strand break repair nuclease NurA [Sulfolobales archaeon]
MLLQLLNELADSITNNSNFSRATVRLTTLEVSQDVEVLDKPKVISRPSRPLVSGAVDAASSNIMTNNNEVALSVGVVCASKITVYPDVMTSVTEAPFAGTLLGSRMAGVTDSYIMLNLRYADDPNLPLGAISHDVRINLESYMISKSLEILQPNTILMIDGPIYYPLHHPKMVCRWNDELSRLNECRTKLIREAYRYGLLPVNIVKRVRNSYYIPPSISSGVSDVEFVEALIKDMNVRSKPIRTPIYLYRRGEGPARYFTYVAVPKSSIYNTYSVFRIEVLKEVFDDMPYDFMDDALSYIVFEAYDYGLDIPYRLSIADSYSKGVLSKMTKIFVNMLIMRGVSIPYEALEYE